MIYREVLTTPKINICNLSKLMKTDKKLINRWALAIAEIVEDTVPGQIHECPYHASLSSSLTMKTDFTFVFRILTSTTKA